jgi:hypothetical protein
MTLAVFGRGEKIGFLRETEPIFLRRPSAPEAAERMFERCLAGRVDENFSKCEYAVEVEPKSSRSIEVSPCVREREEETHCECMHGLR